MGATKQDVGSALARRLGAQLELTPAEMDALDTLEARPRVILRGRAIDGSGQPGFYVLRSGWAASGISLADGRRQIACIHLPGDLLGMLDHTRGAGVDVLSALTDVEVGTIDRGALARLFEAHPRLGALLLLQAHRERLSLNDRLAAVGRTDAKARLAGLILDLASRQRALDPSLGATMPMPLTQEEIGDALGLTAVHVNRMMRQLAEAGLIARGTGASITLCQEDRLAELSGFVDRANAIETDWLPAPRG